MKKWITGTAIACTILSTATFGASAKHPFDGVRFRNWIAFCGQQIPRPELPEINIPGTNKPETNTPNTDNTVPEVKPETKPEIQDSTYAKQVLDLVNTERTKNGLKPLVLDEALNAVALAHSKDMADRNYFSHSSPEGERMGDRLKKAGISYSAAGENIAAGQRTPAQVVQSWMNSEGHRKNILNASFNKMGLGCVETQSGYGIYWTQVFTN